MEKLKLTTHLAGLLPPEMGYTTEVAYTEWWYNPRKNGGFRLTHTAYTIFKEQLCMPCYEMEVQPSDVNLKTLIELDRKLKEPYYIEMDKKMPSKIIFFGSKEAMTAKLYGNIRMFLKNYA